MVVWPGPVGKTRRESISFNSINDSLPVCTLSRALLCQAPQFNIGGEAASVTVKYPYKKIERATHE